ncbi:MAG: hypothetical protein IZT58_12610 [Actinobacteria bacterium]|nr:hypothetical protein [Actinomycetota bacterium]
MLDDAGWGEAIPIVDFSQKVPLEGAEPSVSTEVRLLYDENALYVGARMYHADPANIRTTLTRRDGDSDAERLVIFLDTFHDRRTAYSFGVSAAGVRFDTYYPEDNEKGEAQFDPVWTTRVNVDAQGWTAEMRIPFTQLRFNAADPQVWGLEITRFIPERNEEIQWVLIPRESAGFASNFGILNGIEGIRPSRRLEIMPYAAGDLTLRSDVDPADPFDQKTQRRAGVDLKMGLGPNLTLDVTVNPDFGQVEADPAEVNLTAFETVFPERRPFFIEGNGMLEGRQGFIRLPKWYYSRRIGAAPRGEAEGDFVKMPVSTTIATAAKVTGRLASGLSVGALAGFTPRERATTYDVESGTSAEVPVEPAAAYGVLRLQQQVGSQQSAIGMVVTSTRRLLDDGDPLAALLTRASYTAGVDWKARLKEGKYEITGFAGASRVEGDSLALQRLQLSSARYYQRPDQNYVTFDPHLTSMNGYSAGIRADKNAGRWSVWGIGLTTRSPGFEINDLGQMKTSDDIAFNADYQLRDTQPGKLFRYWQFGHSVQSAWSYGGVRQASTLNQTLALDFHNFWSFRYSTSRAFKGLSDVLTRGGPLMATPSGWRYQARLSGNPGARISWNTAFTYSHDEFQGWQREANGGLQFRLAPRWQASVNMAYKRSVNPRQYVNTRDDGGTTTYGNRYIFSYIERSELSAPIRLEYSFTPDLTVEGYAEPFAASGRYFDFGELPAPEARDLRTYGTDGTTITRQADGSQVVTDDGTSFTIDNLDFNRLFMRSNLVIRWEWTPGSTLYLIWQQNRRAYTSTGDLIGVNSLGDAITAPGDNFFAIKASYWIGVR